jgi:hypothetical protein
MNVPVLSVIEPFLQASSLGSDVTIHRKYDDRVIAGSALHPSFSFRECALDLQSNKQHFDLLLAPLFHERNHHLQIILRRLNKIEVVEYHGKHDLDHLEEAFKAFDPSFDHGCLEIIISFVPDGRTEKEQAAGT